MCSKAIGRDKQHEVIILISLGLREGKKCKSNVPYLSEKQFNIIIKFIGQFMVSELHYHWFCVTGLSFRRNERRNNVIFATWAS